MDNTIPIKQEHLETLKQFEQTYLTWVKDLGDLTILENQLRKKREKLLQDLDTLEHTQNEYLKELLKEYGPGSINLQEGSFHPT